MLAQINALANERHITSIRAAEAAVWPTCHHACGPGLKRPLLSLTEKLFRVRVQGKVYMQYIE